MSFAHHHLQIQVIKFCFYLNTCYSILKNSIYLFYEIHNQIHHLRIEQPLKSSCIFFSRVKEERGRTRMLNFSWLDSPLRPVCKLELTVILVCPNVVQKTKISGQFVTK